MTSSPRGAARRARRGSWRATSPSGLDSRSPRRGLQVGLSSLGIATPEGRANPIWAAGILALAGLYQLSPMKEACLSRCRQPMTFLMSHWDEGPWRMGLRLGTVCLGCCWALMLIGFAGGLASLGLMALGTVAMTAEKLASGTWLPRILGVACLVAAGFTLGGS